MSISSIRTAMFNAIKATNTDGLRVYRYAQSDYPGPSAVIGWPQDMVPNADDSDSQDFVFTVELLVPLTTPSCESVLEGLIGTVVDAIDGISGAYGVQRVSDFGGRSNDQAVRWIGCSITVEVCA